PLLRVERTTPGRSIQKNEPTRRLHPPENVASPRRFRRRPWPVRARKHGRRGSSACARTRPQRRNAYAGDACGTCERGVVSFGASVRPWKSSFPQEGHAGPASLGESGLASPLSDKRWWSTPNDSSRSRVRNHVETRP